MFTGMRNMWFDIIPSYKNTFYKQNGKHLTIIKIMLKRLKIRTTTGNAYGPASRPYTIS